MSLKIRIDFDEGTSLHSSVEQVFPVSGAAVDGLDIMDLMQGMLLASGKPVDLKELAEHYGAMWYESTNEEGDEDGKQRIRND